MDVDIGANPSAEGGDDEGVESNSQKVVDLIDAFRLNVRTCLNWHLRGIFAGNLSHCISERQCVAMHLYLIPSAMQEQPSYNKKDFTAYIKVSYLLACCLLNMFA